MKRILSINYFLLIIFYSFFYYSCSVSKQINKQARQYLFSDTAIQHGHIGISIFDPSTGKYIYHHNADKYFIPASNTKLFSMYAAMKYLGDSLEAAQYSILGEDIVIEPTGDPSFLNSEFTNQPLLSFLKQNGKTIVINWGNFLDENWGKGWAWNDYPYYYMAEKSAMPMYGNIAKFYSIDDSVRATINHSKPASYIVQPSLFSNPAYWSSQKFQIPNEIVTDFVRLNSAQPKTYFSVKKDLNENIFNISLSYQKEKLQEVPFTADAQTTMLLLTDTIKKSVVSAAQYFKGNVPAELKNNFKPIFSQPTDSILKPMMHRSDNFFAEQILLMAGNKLFGHLSTEWTIDSLLKTDLKDLPQKPRWVDGSGLSRYNLFTPQSFVWLLHKTKKEFSWERIKNILPTGGEGTLKNYYVSDTPYLFAKTGTLSNNCALSGYLITKKNKVLIFSVLANNYSTGATPVRKAVEKFLKWVRENY
ncbi:MAG TPA: D-alanyl-D-alanine carboxypeptidase [Ferruginibacter sp.]|nr:D-alanyl-D-alanine carboxypeptidase [Ferruginibacter sp.]